MPKHVTPGVFVEELRLGRGSIESADTSATAFVGITAKGPLHTPIAVSSFAEYNATYGPVLGESLLSIAVSHYFSNGGRTAVIVSTAHTGKRDNARVTAADITGRARDKTGIHALETSSGNLPSAHILVMPDAASTSSREHASVLKSALAFCEQNRIFYIIDPPAPRSSRNAVDHVINWAKRNDASRHPNAAVYFPRVRCAGSSNKNATMLAPPSGAIAGIYARTDRREGVWKPPAGPDARLLGVNDLELRLTDTQKNRLQGAAINIIRPFPRRGILVWGARTFLIRRDDTEWKYLNVRRLALFIEESLELGLRWTVFEPNGNALWAQVRLSISSFMNHLWRKGALMGRSSREAYFVKCDPGSMSQADILSGRIVALVGFAPLKPAEFITFKLELSTAHAT